VAQSPKKEICQGILIFYEEGLVSITPLKGKNHAAEKDIRVGKGGGASLIKINRHKPKKR
jgi:hypothetical protein